MVCGEAGSVALYLVLAATAILLLLVSTLALQARHELRMGAAETEASEGAGVFMGALEEAAILAQEHPDWPAMELTDGNSECTLKPFGTGGRYRYCRDVLPGYTLTDSETGMPVEVFIDNAPLVLFQYPIRVTWQSVGSTEKQHGYGWILVDFSDTNPDTGKPAVRAVVPYKLACRPVGEADWYYTVRPCRPGS